ncbi:MAG: hypothetical protein IJT76_04735 [Clostridia bacterium]|nr:hypothetical protein [Clostridia bacterium]
MKKRSRRRFLAGPYTVMLAALLAVLLFFLIQAIFHSAVYALLPLLFLILGFSVATESLFWRTAVSLLPLLLFFLLEQVWSRSETFSIGFIVYVFVLFGAASAMCGQVYWRMRHARDASWEQYLKEQSAANLNAQLLTASTMDELCALTMQSIYNITECPTVLFFPDEKGRLKRRRSHPEGLLLYSGEAAEACFRRGGPAGRGTAWCEKSALYCLPVQVDGKTLAVVGLLTGDAYPADPQPLQIAESLLLCFAVAMERLSAIEQAQKNLMEKELEHIRTDFLRSISHDLRTPLTGIIGACSALEQPGVSLNEDARRSLVNGIGQEAAWLLQMVENLLSVTRVGSCAPKLKISSEPVEEVLAEVLEKARSRYPSVRLQIRQPEELLLVPMDPNLIVQVLINLIDNASKYSPSPAVVELTVEERERDVQISVADFGKGMTEEELSSLFEPLLPRTGDSTHGMGLGLSICKSIIKAHGGSIEGKNRKPRGAVFTITLPKEERL